MFPKIVVTIYTVISDVLEFQFLHILVNSWHFQATEDVPTCHIVDLICISLMTNEIENHFVLVSWVLLLSKVPTLTGFANFYNLCIIIYINYTHIHNFYNLLYICSAMSPMSYICITSIFSLLCGFLFHLLNDCLLMKISFTLFLLRHIFLEQRIIAKLKKRYKDFPYTSCSYTWIAFLIINISHQGGTFVTNDEPILTHHYYQSPQLFRIHSSCTFYGFG